MGRKRQKSKSNNEQEFELVDGYYMPKEIVMAFKQLKQCCVVQLIEALQQYCVAVHHVTNDDEEYIEGKAMDGKIYHIPLSPQIISRLEKAIGTKKLNDFIKEYSYE